MGTKADTRAGLMGILGKCDNLRDEQREAGNNMVANKVDDIAIAVTDVLLNLHGNDKVVEPPAQESYPDVCKNEDFEYCLTSRCKWHGSCHRHAMLQPDPSKEGGQ